MVLSDQYRSIIQTQTKTTQQQMSRQNKRRNGKEELDPEIRVLRKRPRIDYDERSSEAKDKKAEAAEQENVDREEIMDQITSWADGVSGARKIIRSSMQILSQARLLLLFHGHALHQSVVLIVWHWLQNQKSVLSSRVYLRDVLYPSHRIPGADSLWIMALMQYCPPECYSYLDQWIQAAIHAGHRVRQRHFYEKMEHLPGLYLPTLLTNINWSMWNIQFVLDTLQDEKTKGYAILDLAQWAHGVFWGKRATVIVCFPRDLLWTSAARCLQQQQQYNLQAEHWMFLLQYASISEEESSSRGFQCSNNAQIKSSFDLGLETLCRFWRGVISLHLTRDPTGIVIRYLMGVSVNWNV